ncbi:hypothetical protein BUALT_Bualt05G0001900 [Buddleja alternifolia]|uniref:Uncharacterized protein n=1 Tax=Buddleja alternifolia TaxID=168488 RepID=A0AAV6XFE0_9LAMI|nr:hypothetical protein BUALT_Bualt05G0001900 [Buddleja alternifolia]
MASPFTSFGSDSLNRSNQHLRRFFIYGAVVVFLVCFLSSYYTSSPSAGFFNQRRSVSPSRVNLHGLSPPTPAPTVRFSIDRSISPRRSIASAPRSQLRRSWKSVDAVLAAQVEHEEIGDDEFSGANRYCRRRSDEASFSGFDSSFLSSAASPCRLSAATEPTFNHV